MRTAALSAVVAVVLGISVIAGGAWQLPSDAAADLIRVSDRTASTRTWFQTGTVFTCRAETQSSCLDPEGPARLELVWAERVTLREFIGFAYMNNNGALTRSQVIGGPDWADTTPFHVEVGLPGSSRAGLIRDTDQIAIGGPAIPLLQRLLADHFQLRVHREQRVLPSLDLVKAGTTAGPDLKPSTATCDPLDTAQRCDFRSGPDFATARGMTMRHLAMQLSWNFPGLSLPVRDQTGLAGKFDYTLSFVPAFLAAPNPRDPNVPNPAAGTGASLQQALEQRLGLKLVEATDTFDVVVIDSVQPMR